MAAHATLLETEARLRRATTDHQAGRIEAAERGYRDLLTIAPEHAEARHMLGILAFQTGRPEMAIALLESAIALQPETVEFRNNLGNMLRDVGRGAEAVTVYHAALAIRPNHADLHANLAKTLAGMDRTADAEAAFRRALELAPDHGDALNDLGNLLCDANRDEEAIACFTAALRLRPDDHRAHNNLGRVVSKQRRYEEAVEHLRSALRMQPDYVKAWFNLAELFAVLRRWDEADACWRNVLQRAPDDAEAHVARGTMLLLTGNLEAGWPELKWYSKQEGRHLGDLGIRFPSSTWSGAQISSAPLVLYADQGLGDAIQFCRYIPFCADRARVHLVVPPALHRLFAIFSDMAVVLSEPPLPQGYVHCPLTGLPEIFRTGLHDIPATVPYLRADPVQTGLWHEQFAGLSGLRVGIVWAGNPRYPADRIRSIPLAQLADALDLPGVSLISLQKDEAAAQLRSLPGAVAIRDPMDRVADLADTAAVIEALDLVIGVDTAVIHLAGALGKPVWLLNRYDTDWRWLLDREDSPWYPTLRQFRQTIAGDWQDPLRRVRATLERLVAGERSALAPASRIPSQEL